SDIILRLRLDERLLEQKKGLSMRDLVDRGIDQPIVYELQHDRLQRQPRRLDRVRALYEGAPARRFNSLQDSSAADGRSHLGNYLRGAHRLAFDCEHAQNLLFECRTAIHLFGEDESNVVENGGGAQCIHLQEGADLSTEELADRLAHHLECESITSEPLVQCHPLLCGTIQLLRNEQDL